MDEALFEQRVSLARLFVEKSPLSGYTPGDTHAMALAADCDENIRGLQSALILYAEEEQWAWDALAAMAAAALKNPRGTMTRTLAYWTADVVAGWLQRPKTGKKKFAQRDLIIAETIYLLTVLRPMKPTRRWEKNRSRITECCADGGSACDAVGIVMGMNYKTVERIWGEWGPYATKRLEPKDGLSAFGKWLYTDPSPTFGIKSDQSSRNLRQLPGNNPENRNDRHRPPAASR